MAEMTINGINLYYEEHGEGPPIACIHGTGGSALVWANAVPKLAQLGHVIIHDRRGSTRSERPEPYERTSVAEHADDAAELLAALVDEPALVIGRSYGGAVALDLALRHPGRVRALVLLEPADVGLTRGATEWVDSLAARLREVAMTQGPDAVGEAFIGEVLEEGAWEGFPEPLQRMFTDNGPAILAETQGEPLEVDAAALSKIDKPVLLVAASDSAPEFRNVTEALAEVLPGSRLSLVDGGHLIDPAAPEVLVLVEALLKSPSAAIR